MKVIVEFESSQKPTDGPMSIARWSFTGEIGDFPRQWQVVERHDVAMKNAAFGYSGQENHQRVVQIENENTGVVSPCLQPNCFDPRRNGSRLETVEYGKGRDGFRLIMREVIY